jgi:hypothetical protein
VREERKEKGGEREREGRREKREEEESTFWSFFFRGGRKKEPDLFSSTLSLSLFRRRTRETNPPFSSSSHVPLFPFSFSNRAKKNEKKTKTASGDR